MPIGIHCIETHTYKIVNTYPIERKHVIPYQAKQKERMINKIRNEPLSLKNRVRWPKHTSIPHEEMKAKNLSILLKYYFLHEECAQNYQKLSKHIRF